MNTMSPKSILREQERMRALALQIGSVRPYMVPASVGYSDPLVYCGPRALGRKAVKLSMFICGRQFKNFMKKALKE
jgi:hypothetical protein